MGRIGSPLGKNEFSWVIKDFSSLGVRAIYSDEFVIGGCKWRLIAYPMGNRIKKYMSLYVEVADSKHLPSGWSINTELRMEVVNHDLYKPSQQKYRKNLWFDQKTPSWGYKTMIPHSKLSGEEGFLVSGEVTIVVKIDVYRVFGKVAAIEISEEGSKEGYEYESEEEYKKESEEGYKYESEEDYEKRPIERFEYESEAESKRTTKRELEGDLNMNLNRYLKRITKRDLERVLNMNLKRNLKRIPKRDLDRDMNMNLKRNLKRILRMIVERNLKRILKREADLLKRSRGMMMV
ncbi:putative MATH/TRAF domain-containing protein [Arabidopsis thaliana]